MTDPIEAPDAEAPDDEEDVPVPSLAPSEPSEEEQAEEEEHEAPAAPEEPAEEQPQGLSEKELERGLAKLEREAERHFNRVREVMGEEAAMLQECPLCDPLIPGLIMPSPQLPDRFPAVRAFIGDREPENWQPDTHRHRCEPCDGYGEVLTGSRRPEQEVMPCFECGGKGWVGDVAAPVASPAYVPPVAPEANGPTTTAPPEPEPAEVAELRRKGYVVLNPQRA